MKRLLIFLGLALMVNAEIIQVFENRPTNCKDIYGSNQDLCNIQALGYNITNNITYNISTTYNITNNITTNITTNITNNITNEDIKLLSDGNTLINNQTYNALNITGSLQVKDVNEFNIDVSGYPTINLNADDARFLIKGDDSNRRGIIRMYPTYTTFQARSSDNAFAEFRQYNISDAYGAFTINANHSIILDSFDGSIDILDYLNVTLSMQVNENISIGNTLNVSQDTYLGDYSFIGNKITANPDIYVNALLNLSSNVIGNQKDLVDFNSGLFNQINANKINTTALYSNADVSSISMVTNDTNDFLYFNSLSDIPYIGTVGGTVLYMRQTGGTWVNVHAGDFVDEVPKDIEEELNLKNNTPLEYQISIEKGTLNVSKTPDSVFKEYEDGHISLSTGEGLVLLMAQLRQLSTDLCSINHKQFMDGSLLNLSFCIGDTVKLIDRNKNIIELPLPEPKLPEIITTSSSTSTIDLSSSTESP